MTVGQRYRAPEEILSSLGISEPEEIDIEAIAQVFGATVVFRPLTGCEARIVGLGDRAVISISAGSIRTRQRFSAAHELGHWMIDAGSAVLDCTPSEFPTPKQSPREVVANRFAADLLLPASMFSSRILGRPCTFETVAPVAEQFNTSLAATAIRLVELSSFPAVVAYSEAGRVKWSHTGCDLPRSMRVTGPGEESFAAALLRDPNARASGDVSSGDWFSLDDTHVLHEDSRLVGPRRVLTLLWWRDQRPLIALQEEAEARQSRRSDGRDDD